MEEMAMKSHVLVLAFPVQGHINPMLQFCKRLASRGVKATFLTTASTNVTVQIQSNFIALETIPDGTSEGENALDDLDFYLENFKASVLKHLPMTIEAKATSSEPVKVLVYDSILPWALDAAHQLGIAGAAFFTQSCAVCAIYHHLHQGTLKVPPEGPNTSLPSMPLLEPHDLPSFVSHPGSYPSIYRLAMDQNFNFGKANWLLFNTVDSLEHEVVDWISRQFPLKTIGPTIPSMYLDKQLKDDKDYGLSLFKPNTEACMKWLDSKANGSVVYASFGSLANLGEEQMAEVAWGLANSKCNFLWVVRATEHKKLPSNFTSDVQEKGLIVNWCSQLEVLAHRAVGCFMTHCGWNSTLEALSLGIPMVVMPQWTDQPTNAKFIVDIWRAGVRVKAGGDKGIVTKEEIECSIQEVMVGEKAIQIKNNVLRWKELAKEAMCEEGSSDKNIEEFVSSLVCN